MPRKQRTQGRVRPSVRPHLLLRSVAVERRRVEPGGAERGGAGQPRRGVGRESGAEGRERAGLSAEEPHPLLLPADLPMEAAGEPLFPREEVLGGGARSAQVRTVPCRAVPSRGLRGSAGSPAVVWGSLRFVAKPPIGWSPSARQRAGERSLCLGWVRSHCAFPPTPGSAFSFAPLWPRGAARGPAAERGLPWSSGGSRRWAPDFVLSRSLVNKYSGVQRKGMAPYQRFTGRLDAIPSVFLAQDPFLVTLET